jgi:hypothetical protein
MCGHKSVFPRTVKSTAITHQRGAMELSDGQRCPGVLQRLARPRERLGGREATSRLERGKGQIGRAFATRVRRITDHLKFKISHIRCESRGFCEWARG